jgi:hypothetical protein
MRASFNQPKKLRAFFCPFGRRRRSLPASPKIGFNTCLSLNMSRARVLAGIENRPEFENVIGVSLGVPCLFRFRRKRAAPWEWASLELQPRSAYLLREPAHWDWQHSIPLVDKLRYSITFRSLP